jgi:hypothetical protein
VLTLKSLRKEGIDVSANPESFAKEEALDSKDLKNKLPALVKFSQWKKIEVIENIQLPMVCYCKETLAIAILAGWSICPIVNK